MSCNTTCLNDGLCLSNDTCQCAQCYMGKACETSTNVIKFSLTYAIHWDIREYSVDSNFNLPKMIYTTVIACMLVLAILNTLVSLPTFFSHNIRLTNCGVFQIFYCLTGLLTIIGMQLRMLTMLEFDYLTQSYSYRFIACNIIPVLVIIMGDICMWISALLAIEFILLEWFNLSLYRTRRFAMISSIICFVLVTGSHLHEIIARGPKPYPNEPNLYTCTFIYTLPVDIIDRTLRACHIIIPCTIHFISSLLILISITRRIIMVRGRTDFFHVFVRECFKRKYVFIPPTFIIIANLPHLILHLIDECEDARDIVILRRHVSFNILVYLPACMTFFIYIYPSKSYLRQFRRTHFGQLIQRIKTTKIANIKVMRSSQETLTSNLS